MIIRKSLEVSLKAQTLPNIAQQTETNCCVSDAFHVNAAGAQSTQRIQRFHTQTSEQTPAYKVSKYLLLILIW